MRLRDEPEVSAPAGPVDEGASERSETTLVTKFDPSDQNQGRGGDLQAIFTVLSGPETGIVFRLEQPELVIGRDEGLEITLSDAGLSRRHASINRTAFGTFVRDLGSTNGTYVNAQRLVHAHELKDGDRIQLGQGTVLRFSLQDRLEQEAAERMYEMTVRDPLTHLYNRRHLDERLSSEFAYALRHHGQLCVLMVDVDHFKHINDAHGHAAGDEVLRRVALGLQQIVRLEDLVARYGGEEFVILARGIDANGGVAFAERVRTYLGGMGITWGGGTLSITVSIGVACMEGGGDFDTVAAFLSAADGALYRAKANGRDRVERAEGLVQAPPLGRRPPYRGVTAPQSALVMPRSRTGASGVNPRAATQQFEMPVLPEAKKGPARG